MNITNEEIKNECLSRMEMLNLSRQCINAFKKGVVWESESIGALYELNDKEKEIVKEFEEKHKGCKVYHVIHNITEFGELYNLLYVSTDKDEWERDKEDIRQNCVFVYVKNIDIDYYSEFGIIGIKKNIGGLIRVA